MFRLQEGRSRRARSKSCRRRSTAIRAQAAELEAWTQGVLGETNDHKEAVRAFSEKRAPKFTGT